MGDRGQRTMAEQFHSCSDHRPQAGQVETLEAISSEGLGRSPEKEMGGTPILAHLIPHAGEIPHLAPLRGDNEELEFHDLLGDTRFRTLRQRCLVLEQMLKWDLPIPWKESNIRELLNRLRAQEVTPHKLQLCWDTLRWFAKKFGLLAVQEEHRLLQKKQTVETGLTPAVVQPARKAKVPPKEVIWALANSPQEKGAYAPRELDTFILGIVRYQVGCSARFNDLQHTAPSTLKHTTTTLEFSACRTDPETSGSLDLSKVFLHRPCMVATFTYMVDPPLEASKL